MIREDEKQRLREDFNSNTYYDGDAVRWKSSKNAVPEDIMYFWRDDGLVGDTEVAATEAARSDDLDKAITGYRWARANMTEEQKAEEAYERRAAFGEGERVINVFTGEEYIT